MMTFNWIHIFVFTYIISSECSQVIHKHRQKGIHISDYCPKVGACEEGTHVICLYYNPVKKMGPTCNSVVDISITPDFAQMILDVFNRIRSRIAAGLTKGSNGAWLPKGYGIYRLNWDEELATFAQVWANQCILKTDLCRDTKNFSRVGQTLGMSRFTIDNWQPINSQNFSDSAILTLDKIKHAIISVIKAWYDTRKGISPEDIKTVDRSSSTLSNQFIYMIYGNLTHVGCGLSAYREFAYHDNNAALIYNSVQIVCNYSARLQSGYQVYTTDPPTKPGYTVKCGCPLGYDEDDECLCYESGRKFPYSCKESSRCKPAVAVLPIFTVDDAPKALQDFGHNNATLPMNTNEIFDRYDAFNRRRNNNKKGILVDNTQKQSGLSVQRYPVDVKSRYFDIDKGSRKDHRIEIPHQSPRVGSKKSKQSVFSIAPIFELNIRRTNPITYKKLGNKNDVAPRKDFSELQNLVSNYLERKRNSNTGELGSNGYFSFEPNNSYKNPNTFKNQQLIQNNFIPEPKNISNHLNSSNNLKYDDEKFINTDADRKLMSLLDALEQKIKETEMNTIEKEIFDEKIHKIYLTLVGKSNFKEKYNPNVLWNNQSIADEISNYNIEVYSDHMLRNDYFDSIRPEDFSYRDIKDNNAKFDSESKKNFSRDNHNIEVTDHPTFNDDIVNRAMRNVYYVRKKTQRHLSNDNYIQNIKDEDLIESDRRRYYDNKLAALRRKIDLMKSNVNQHKIRQDRKLRPVRPTKPVEDMKSNMKSKESLNTFYMPDRARFLHGF